MMANIVSRAFRNGAYFHANNNLTTYFNVHFPLPQNLSWIEFILPTKLTQRVMSCLLSKPLTMGSLLRLPQIAKNIGKNGFDMLPPGKLTHTSNSATNLTSSSSLALLLQGSRQVSLEEAFKSRFLPLLRPSWPLQRPPIWLDNPVPSKRQKMTTSCQSNASSKD